MRGGLAAKSLATTLAQESNSLTSILEDHHGEVELPVAMVALANVVVKSPFVIVTNVLKADSHCRYRVTSITACSG